MAFMVHWRALRRWPRAGMGIVRYGGLALLQRAEPAAGATPAGCAAHRVALDAGHGGDACRALGRA